MSDLGGVEPTTGAPYEDDDYAAPEGCTGFYREDIDLGDTLTHTQSCPVHDPNNCPLCGNPGWCTDRAECEERHSRTLPEFSASPGGEASGPPRLDTYYGPTAWDPDPGAEWHVGCDGRVLWFKEGDICDKCGADADPPPGPQVTEALP